MNKALMLLMLGLVLLIVGCIGRDTYIGEKMRVCDANFKTISPNQWTEDYLDNDKCRICGSEYIWNESINDWYSVSECIGGHYEWL